MNEVDLFRSLLTDVKQEMERGEAPVCFARTFWENEEEYGLSVDEAAYVIGTLFEAGSGTTAAAMMSFCLCMCLHPEWQRKGQAEVDHVCGDRMPEFEDLPRLPTCRAIIKEVARWRPVTAGGNSNTFPSIDEIWPRSLTGMMVTVGVPHQLVKDDEYDGFFFPAGTNIHANQWSHPFPFPPSHRLI